MTLEKSIDFGQTWSVLQHFRTDCYDYRNNLGNIITTENPDAVTCTEKYSVEQPYTGGKVIFDVLNDRFALFLGPFFINIQRLQEAYQRTNLGEFLRMTDLRIRLLKPATDGKEFPINQDLVKYHYAISDITVVAGYVRSYI
jgi:netrin-G1 ligand/netrin-G2